MSHRLAHYSYTWYNVPEAVELTMPNTYETVADLKARITKVEQQHLDRRIVHEQDHSLWRLDQYVLEEIRHNSRLKKENYPSVTSNAPRTLSRAVMAMLNKNRPSLRLQLPPDVSTEESDTINANERLIEGALYENDLIRGRRGDAPLQEELTWFIAHRGGAIFRVLVRPGDKASQFPIDVYDPWECSFDEGYDGLLFHVRHYTEDRASVMDRWAFEEGEEPVSNSSDEVEMFDVWWISRGDDPATPDPESAPRVYNAVIAGNKFAKEPTHEADFDHIPIYVIRPGGTPARMSMFAGDSGNRWRADQWESIYSGVRETVGWINRAATLYSLYLRDGAIGPWVYKGTRNKNIGTPKAFTTIRIAPGEEFGPVGMPQMAGEAKEFLGFVQSEWAKAGVSDVVFGNLPFTVSGFGMLQLRGAVEVLIGSYVKATERAYTYIAHELTEQFVKVGGRRKFSLKGFDRRGKVFMERISPRDIQKVYIPQVTLKDGMPDDPVAMGNAANLWSQAGAPRREIYERIFNADDAGEWERQRRREELDALPEVKMLEGITDLLRAGKKESAALLMQMMQASGVMGPGNQGPARPGQPPADQQPPEEAGIGEREGNYGGGGRPRQAA